jgi:hypothetical protein
MSSNDMLGNARVSALNAAGCSSHGDVAGIADGISGSGSSGGGANGISAVAEGGGAPKMSLPCENACGEDVGADGVSSTHGDGSSAIGSGAIDSGAGCAGLALRLDSISSSTLWIRL